MARTRKSEETLPKEKKVILELLNQVRTGEVAPNEAHIIWDKIYSH